GVCTISCRRGSCTWHPEGGADVGPARLLRPRRRELLTSCGLRSPRPLTCGGRGDRFAWRAWWASRGVTPRTARPPRPAGASVTVRGGGAGRERSGRPAARTRWLRRGTAGGPSLAQGAEVDDAAVLDAARPRQGVPVVREEAGAHPLAEGAHRA